MIWAPYVKWEDAPVTMSADEAMAALAGGPEGRNALEEAKQFLIEVLGQGGQEDQKEIKRQAEEAGFGWRTVRRAKELLRVEACREGGIGEKGRWVWRLSKTPKVSIRRLATLAILVRKNGGKRLRCLRWPTYRMDTLVSRMSISMRQPGRCTTR